MTSKEEKLIQKLSEGTEVKTTTSHLKLSTSISDLEKSDNLILDELSSVLAEFLLSHQDKLNNSTEIDEEKKNISFTLPSGRIIKISISSSDENDIV